MAWIVLRNGDCVGDSAEVFYAEMDSVVMPALGRLVAALDDAAQTTLGIRAVMAQAELDVAAIFKEREEGGAGKGKGLASGVDDPIPPGQTPTPQPIPAPTPPPSPTATPTNPYAAGTSPAPLQEPDTEALIRGIAVKTAVESLADTLAGIPLLRLGLSLLARSPIPLTTLDFAVYNAILAIFDDPLAQKMFKHFSYGAGAPYILSKEEMINANPIISVEESPKFKSIVSQLTQKGGGEQQIEFSGPASALTQGTLAQFTANYKGIVKVTPDGQWSFNGAVSFQDTFDFDPRPPETSGRTNYGESATRFCAVVCAGTSYEVHSEALIMNQSINNPVKFVDYPNYVPRHTPNALTRNPRLMQELEPLLRFISHLPMPQ